MSLTYAQLAARNGEPYMVRIFTECARATLRHCISTGTLDEAIDYADGSEQAELLSIDEPIPGAVVETKLADIIVGEWLICDTTKELTMAKVKDVKKNTSRKAVLDELLGDPVRKGKKEKKPVKAAKPAKKASKGGGGARNAAFEADQRIKVLKKYDKTPREGSNLDLSLGVLKNNMTVGDWNKARAKAGVENVGFGYLHMLVNDGYVKVV